MANQSIHRSFWFISLWLLSISLALAGPAHAAARRLSASFSLAAHTPPSNATGVPLNTPVTAGFAADLNQSTVSTSTFTVRGEYTAVYQGSFSFPTASSLSFDPAADYKAGEKISVTASKAITSTLGGDLQPYTWQFTAAALGGTGIMTAHPVMPSFGIDEGVAAALGDLDGDGDLDFVMANAGVLAEQVWMNDGMGGYQPHPSLPTFGAGNSHDVALGDLDGDGDLDAVVANYIEEAQTVWLNDGTGGFSAHPTTPSFGAGYSLGLALGDLDGDGDLDAVVANYYNLVETVWLNDGMGSFSAHPVTPEFGDGSGWGAAVALGDLDGDGDLDAVVANNGAETAWLNDGTGSFSAHPTTPDFGSGQSKDVALGDLDGDGDLDAVVANTTNQAETVWLNDGTGSFSPHPVTPNFGAEYSNAVVLGDLDGDGDLDAVVANSANHNNTVWLNDGSGSFSAHPAKPGFGVENSNDVVLGDLDGDGDLDAVAVNYTAMETVWLNADAWEVADHGPASNRNTVAAGAPVTATFTADVSAGSVSTATFTARSSFSGVFEGTYSFPTADSLHFAPAQLYKPGETVFVTASSGVTNTQGVPLKPYTWQFTAATGGGTGLMFAQPVTPTFGAGSSQDVALGDLDGDGDLDAVVANDGGVSAPPPGEAETVWLNNGSGGFDLLAFFGDGQSAAVALGDLDGDGDLDAVVANYGLSKAETVWLNDGGGGFSAHPVTPSFGAGDSTAVALGDLDGDGDLDAVVASAIGAVTVWLNNGSGGFSAGDTFNAGLSLGVALGDLDGDGDLDAVIANQGSETVWLNTGAGSFSAHPATPSFGGGYSYDVALGDLDGDGDLDAVVANNNQPATVWLNDGTGSFSAHPVTPSFGGGWGMGVALGDLDGDGDLDAVVAKFDGQAETVWLNDGSGDFSAGQDGGSFGAGSSLAVALGDLDGDGDLDAVVANYDGQAETVWLNADALDVTNHGPASNLNTAEASSPVTATFTANVSASSVSTATFTVRSGMTGVYEGTFTFPTTDSLHFAPLQPYKPGEILFVTASSGVTGTQGALLKPYTWQFTAAAGGGTGIMVSHPISPTFGAGYSTDVVLGDLDGDGYLDAVVANSSDEAETVWLNDGTGSFSVHPSTPTFGAGQSTAVALGDLDSDGDLDAVVVNYVGAETVWLNDGTGSFSAHPDTPGFGAGNGSAVALGDLDGDGDLDAVVSNYDPDVGVWLNDGTGSFSAHPVTPHFGYLLSSAVVLGDLDGDGDLDAVVANFNGEQTVWLNDGAGSFSAHLATPSFGIGTGTAVALGDLDGDSDLDVVAANANDEAETVWLNDGTGGFSAHPATPSFGAGESRDVALGDLDGDGDLDAVVANDGGAQTVWLNDGTGQFSAGLGGGAFGAENSFAVALGDLDGDGDLDAVVANTSWQAQTVWLNRELRSSYQQNFETPVGSEWCGAAQAQDTTPLGNRGFLGQFGNQTACLSLVFLAPHQAVQVSFDLYIIRSWNGSQGVAGARLPGLSIEADDAIGPDRWQFAADGTTWLDTTFSNWPGHDQAYPAPFGSGLYPYTTGAVEVNSLGYIFNGLSMDAVYHLTFLIPHTANTLNLDFTALGLQDLANESWGLDNLSVTLVAQLHQLWMPLVSR